MPVKPVGLPLLAIVPLFTSRAANAAGGPVRCVRMRQAAWGCVEITPSWSDQAASGAKVDPASRPRCQLRCQNRWQSAEGASCRGAAGAAGVRGVFELMDFFLFLPENKKG